MSLASTVARRVTRVASRARAVSPTTSEWISLSIATPSTRLAATAIAHDASTSSSSSSSLLDAAARARVSEDLRRMGVRKLDGDGAHGRRVALVPLGTFNKDPCVVMTVTEDMMRGARVCALPSAGVEESTLLESSSVTTTRAARRASEALFGEREDATVELLGASHDVLDERGRTVVTPVLVYFGEVGERVRGRKDVAAISLSTVMSLEGIAADGDGVKFIGTLEAEGLSGYEASALHGALRVVAGRNRAYKEALYDQFAPGYARSAPAAAHVESLLNPSRAPNGGEHATG
jgi:hypothetical protein